MTDQPTRNDVDQREQGVAEAFVRLADTLVDDYDVVDLLDQLAASCLDLLGVGAAGLLLKDAQNRLIVIATTSEEARLLEVFQLQNNEGPCLESVTSGGTVAAGYLEDQGQRWPQFAPAAIAAGFRSVAAVPLRLRSETIGALNLFNHGPEPITDADQMLARALADIATIGILQERLIHEGNVIGDQLQHALSSRVLVEQAKGVLAERSTLSMEAAFALLRSYARDHNLKLTEVARQIVDGDLVLT